MFRKAGVIVFFIISHFSLLSQIEKINGVHVFSDTTFVSDSITLGWSQPDSLYDGLRAVVYFHDGVEYFMFQDSNWVRILDSIPDVCSGKFQNYEQLRNTDPGIVCKLVYVSDFSDTIGTQIRIVKGGMFMKDTTGTEDFGLVIASDTAGVFYKRIHNGEIFPDWWENLKDSKKIQKAVQVAGNGGKVVLTSREYNIDDEIFLDSLKNVHLDGNKAILKASDGVTRNAVLAAPYNQGDYTIEVQNIPSSWEVGDILVLVGDSTNTGTSGRSQIDSIIGNTVYLRYYFTGQSGGLFPTQPAGKKVIKNLNLIRGLPSVSEAVFGEAGSNQGVIIENIIFDGNKQNDNETSLSWSVNNLIFFHGRGSEIRSCKFMNAPTEVITGHGINVHDNVFEDCNGSVYHLSANDSMFNLSYPAYFVNNTVINCNTTLYNVNGHNEGIISFSWNGGYIIINGNYLVSGTTANGVIGSLQGYMQGDNDREIVILSNNYCKGFNLIIFGSHQTTTRSLMITGNIFENCEYLAPNPQMSPSVKICGNVQAGTTNFGISFRNSCEYQTIVDQSFGLGKNALLNTTATSNTAVGHYSLDTH